MGAESILIWHLPTPLNHSYTLYHAMMMPFKGHAHTFAQTSAHCHAHTHMHIHTKWLDDWARPFPMSLGGSQDNRTNNVSLRGSTILEALSKASRIPYEFYISIGSSGVKLLQSFYDNAVNIEEVK